MAHSRTASSNFAPERRRSFSLGRRFSRSNSLQSDEEVEFQPQYVKLLKSENTPMKMMFPSIGLLTCYEVIEDFPETWLFERINRIIKANPWLNGRLVTCKDGIYIRYDPETTFQGFEIHYNKGIIPEATVTELYTNPVICSLVIPPGKKCVDKDEQLFKISIFKEGTKRVSIFVNMSHILGDGCTLYTLYKMFDYREDVFPLIAERFQGFEDRLPAILGDEVYAWQQRKASMIGLGLSSLKGNKTFTMNVIDLQHVERMKKEAALEGEVKFVSTNDVFSSWYYKASECDFGTCAVNFRSRIPEITMKHAGNYIYESIFGYNNFKTPASYRKFIDSFNGGARAHVNVPGLKKTLAQNCSFLTNWSTFYHDLQIEGCESIIHCPHYPLETVIKIPWNNSAILYKAGPKQTAVCISSIKFNAYITEEKKAVENKKLKSCMISSKNLELGENALPLHVDSSMCIRAMYSKRESGEIHLDDPLEATKSMSKLQSFRLCKSMNSTSTTASAGIPVMDKQNSSFDWPEGLLEETEVREL